MKRILFISMLCVQCAVYAQQRVSIDQLIGTKWKEQNTEEGRGYVAAKSYLSFTEDSLKMQTVEKKRKRDFVRLYYLSDTLEEEFDFERVGQKGQHGKYIIEYISSQLGNRVHRFVVEKLTADSLVIKGVPLEDTIGGAGTHRHKRIKKGR